MNIILPSQYPRSERLVAATRDCDRGRIQVKELEAIRHEDIKALLKLQKGFAHPSNGLFLWQDLMRPFADIIEGASSGVLTRFYETNTFWKVLECPQGSKVKEKDFDAWIERYFFAEGINGEEDALVFTLPFLFLFNEYSNGLTLAQISSLLEKIAKRLISFPKKALCFYEPTLGWRSLTTEEKKSAAAFFTTLKKTSDTPLYLYSSFFSIKSELPFLLSLPIDGLGVDFYANTLEDILPKFPEDKSLLAGVIQTESTLLENGGKIGQFVEETSKYISPERLLISPNGPAELLPRIVMDAKVNSEIKRQKASPALHASTP